MKYSLDISNFLEEISSLAHSIVFLYFFSLISEEGFLISPCYSLELFTQTGISFLFSKFVFHVSSFLSYLYGLLRQPFCLFAFFSSGGWFWSLPPVMSQYCEPPSIVLQGPYLSDLIPWIYFLFPLYNFKRFIWFRSYVIGLVVFPIFNFSLNLAIRSSWSEPQSAPGLVFADCIERLHLWLPKHNQSVFSIDHVVMSMCRVFSCVVGRGCLLWPVCSLGKSLFFAVLHSVLQGQTCLLLQVSLDFLLLHSGILWW